MSFVLNTLHVLVSTSCVKRSHYNASRATVAISWGKWSEVKVTQSCPTLCDPMDYPVHGILQAWILEWEAIPFSRGSSQPRDRSQVSCTAGGFFASWATGKPSWGKALTMMPRTKWALGKRWLVVPFHGYRLLRNSIYTQFPSLKLLGLTKDRHTRGAHCFNETFITETIHFYWRK